MSVIDDKIQALELIQDNMDSLIEEQIALHAYVIALMNVEDQLYIRGVNSDGVRLDDLFPYSFATIRIKQSKGQPTDRVTLRDTGAFHDSVRVITSSSEFRIVATDEKTQALMFKYGENILGLTNDNVDDLMNNYILDKLIEAIKEAI